MSGSVRSLVGAAASAAVLLAAASAFAHGGTISGGIPPSDPSVPLGPPWHPPHFKQNDPEVTPGSADPQTAVTRWETWWGNNKDAFLRLSERMAGDLPGSTPDHVRTEREIASDAKRLAGVRRRLAALFVEALSDGEREVRTASAIALGKCGDPSGSEPLRRAASSDEDKDVRDAALLGLGMLACPADVPFLETRLLDKDARPRHRAFAAFALGLEGGEDAAVPLLRFAGESSGRSGALRAFPELTASVYVGMGLTGSPDVVPALHAAFSDTGTDLGVRSFVLISQGRLRDRTALAPAVTTLVSERDPGMRRAAAVALARLTEPTDDTAIAALVAAAHSDRDPLTRHFAAMALGGIAAPHVKETLRGMFTKGDDAERSFAALAIALQHDLEFAPEIRGALARTTDDSTRSSFCLALGLLGDLPSAPVIEKQLSAAKSIWLEGYAALSLGLLGATSSAEVLRTKLESEADPRVRMNLAIALGLLRDARAKTYLVETMRKGETFYERGSAALAIGALRMTSAVSDLEIVFRDTKEKDLLRAFAVVAMGEIADPSPIPKLSRFAIGGNYDASVKVDPLNEILTIY